MVSKKYSISHYKLKDCLDLWQYEEATSDRHQWPSIRLRHWIPLDYWIRRRICHFSSTAISKYCWRKNIRIQEKSVYTGKLFGFKRFLIQSSHFRFRVQNLRRHDQTGMFSFRICPLVCKWQNQSGTKTLRIHHESGTISSSVNLVWVRVLHYCWLSLAADRGTAIKQYRSRIGCHNNFVKAKDSFSRVRGRFWNMMLMMFYSNVFY